jgi:two-component system nitrate/nitrite sensor histidine kinase NarX
VSWWRAWQTRWAQSARLRVAVQLAVFAVVLLTLLLLTAIEVLAASGLAGTINRVGAWRAGTRAVAIAVVDARGSPAARVAAVEELDLRLSDPQIWQALEGPRRTQQREALREVVRQWRESLRPLALADTPAGESTAAAGPAPSRGEFMRRMPEFVGTINAVVGSIEAQLQDSVDRALWRLSLAGALLLIGAAVLMSLLYRQWFAPTEALMRATERLRRGDFSVRVSSAADDELGRLGQTFNLMVQEVVRLTDVLEHEVADKTADLAQRNRSLTLLYQVTRRLTEHAADERALTDVLTLLQQALDREDLIGCALRLSHAGAARVGDDAGGLQWSDLHVTVGAVQDFGPPHRADVVLVAAEPNAQGTLTLWLRGKTPLDLWQQDLVAAIARHIGAARAAGQWREEHRRAAVLQERTAIARELHDSLAQTLSYTRIQIVRLAVLLEATEAAGPARAVLTELRDGITAAYRQLRELLTQFRLGVGEAGLSGALRLAIGDFERRGAGRVWIDNELVGDELSPETQAHVLQVVREALSNVERHAHATETRVRLARSVPVESAEDDPAIGSVTESIAAIEVSIEDNGVGIPDNASRAGHFGLAIMRDRARAIGGGLTIERRRVEDGSGTRVRLRVPLSGHERGGE